MVPTWNTVLLVLAILTQSAIRNEATPQFPTFGRPFGSSGGNRFAPPALPGFGRPSSPGGTFFRPVQQTQPSFVTASRPTSFSSAPVFSAPVQATAPTSVSGGGSDVEFQGRTYHLSWRAGRSDLTWNDAQSYCSRRGMRMISLDNSAKVQHFFRLLESDRAPYFWAGATTSGDKRSLIWANGNSEPINPGSFPWSHTGSKRQPQPDGGSLETCLAVLNNFYQDGTRFHDVSCPHKKPTICEN